MQTDLCLVVSCVLQVTYKYQTQIRDVNTAVVQVCYRQPATAASAGVGSLGQDAPRSRLATERSRSATSLRAAATSMSADVAEGDVVVVVGASGGIGRLVTQRYAPPLPRCSSSCPGVGGMLLVFA